MAVYKCKMCGGTLEETTDTIAVCEYCGTKQTLPKGNNDIVSNLYNRANNLRFKCEFDKAEQAYEKILEVDNNEAEAHWGMVLCKYGIEYVEDPATGARVPTCHRTSFDVILKDAAYLSAIANADANQKAIYEDEANKINVIQRNILEVVKKEKPFDVFICYKETDANGSRTIDSVIANDIYHQLVSDGFKVFYAAITLEDKLGQEYEPYIFAALNSAKVMLVIGTKPEYFEAVWVKNEWSRFLKLIKTDRSKILIPCYKGMDAYDLPEEFSHLQAQDMGKIGFINDVERGIKKVLLKDAPKPSAQTDASAAPLVNIDTLLKRVFIFLEDGNYDSANEYCEKVLDVDPENGKAYLGKLMVELRVKNIDSLQYCHNSFEKSANYQKIIRYADDEIKNTVVGYSEAIRLRKLEDMYVKTYQKYTNETSIDELKRLSGVFKSLGNYKDSQDLAVASWDKAETIRKDGILTQGKHDMQTDAVFFYKRALENLENIRGWRDADECIALCQRRINEIETEEERARVKRLTAYKRKRLIKKGIKLSIVLIIVFLIYSLLNESIFKPMKYYDDGVELMAQGDYVAAKDYFIAANGYDNSEDMIDICTLKIDFQSYVVGDNITFGYLSGQPIVWRILAIEDGKALIITEQAIKSSSFGDSWSDNVNWSNSTIRQYLNGEFLYDFNSAEEELIIETELTDEPNPISGVEPGESTFDKVFLLSIREANQYFATSYDRACTPTDVAIDQGVYTYNNYCYWWLRSPGSESNYAARVRLDGVVGYGGCSVGDYETGVRPAMWIDIS